MATGVGELVLQTAGETRLVVDCKMNPTALVGQAKMTFVPEGMVVSCAGVENKNYERSVDLTLAKITADWWFNPSAEQLQKEMGGRRLPPLFVREARILRNRAVWPAGARHERPSH